MKGLLLKDLYMTWRYCKSILLLAAIFLAASVIGSGNLFFVLYPVVVVGLLPVTLLGVDEGCRWLQYSGTLPYTRGQIVSAKYLIGLFAQLLMLAAMVAAQGVRMAVTGGLLPERLLTLTLILLAVSLFAAAIPLPILFRMGVEKGRFVSYCMVGFAFGASFAAPKLLGENFQSGAGTTAVLAALCLLGGALYALSWYLSVVFYKRREL